MRWPLYTRETSVHVKASAKCLGWLLMGSVNEPQRAESERVSLRWCWHLKRSTWRTRLLVKDQVCKKWNPRKGDLPIFYVSLNTSIRE